MVKCWLNLLCGLLLTTALWAQTAPPTVEVAPTSKIKYPNAADVLNPTPAAAPKAAVAAPAAPSVPAPSALSSDWVWLWTVQGSEAEVRDWAKKISAQTSVRNLSDTSWEVTVPVGDWNPAASAVPQAQRAVLVRR